MSKYIAKNSMQILLFYWPYWHWTN